ncbi:MAG: AAA family ATPase, partial [Candidatus Kapabacteria bacterium]|nr:AAA family ATPase [Candidatus Kapabacteria bacterium]
KILNILGHDQLEFNAGRYNLITGANGTGKTSVMEALKAVFTGGHDATLKRNGAESGEIVLVLDDDTIITKKVDADDSQTKVSKDGRSVKSPMTHLKQLFDGYSLNPAGFLLATDKQRLEMLLQTVPTRVGAQQLYDATGELFNGDIEPNAIEVIQALRDNYYTARRDVNRDAKQIQGTIEQMQSTLIDVSDLSRESMEQVEAEIQRAYDTRTESLAALAREKEVELAELNRKYELKTTAVQVQAEEVLVPLSQKKAALQATWKVHIEQENARKRIAELEAQCAKLNSESELHTQRITKLDALNRELLDHMPVNGMSIVDGVIHLDGVPFERVNTARQVQFALQLAVIRARQKDLSLVCMDGMELLSTEAFSAFSEAAQSLNDIQFFVTRVSDTSLMISSDGDNPTSQPQSP